MAYAIILLNNKHLSIFVNIWSILVTPIHVCYADQSRRRFLFIFFLICPFEKYMFLVFAVFVGQYLVNIGQYSYIHA